MNKIFLSICCLFLLNSCTTQSIDMDTVFSEPGVWYCYRLVSKQKICARSLNVCLNVEEHVEHEEDIASRCRQYRF